MLVLTPQKHKVEDWVAKVKDRIEDTADTHSHHVVGGDDGLVARRTHTTQAHYGQARPSRPGLAAASCLTKLSGLFSRWPLPG